MPAVMALTAGNMMSYNHALSDCKIGNSLPAFDNRTGQFMTKHDWRRYLFHNFQNIGPT
jgi:hypothetical protein